MHSSSQRIDGKLIPLVKNYCRVRKRLQVLEIELAMRYNSLTTASNGRFLLPYIVLYKLPIVRMRALEAVVSTRTVPGSRHFVFGE
jgi:hypothetical protein